MAYIDIDLTDFSDDDIREEAIARNLFRAEDDIALLVTELYQKRRLGKDYQTELDQLIWMGLGKVI
jgi:hypothetical protein